MQGTPEIMPLRIQDEPAEPAEQAEPGYPHVYDGWNRGEVYQKTIQFEGVEHGHKYMLLTDDFHNIYEPNNRRGVIPPLYRSIFNQLMDEFIGCYIQFGEVANSFQLREGYRLPLLNRLNGSIRNLEGMVLLKREEAMEGGGILDYSRAISLFNNISVLYKTAFRMLYQANLDRQAELEMQAELDRQAGGAVKVKKSKRKSKKKIKPSEKRKQSRY